MTDTENVRFKIVLSLIKNKKPMKLSEIAKKTDLRDHHVFYHLKKLKEDYRVIEVEDKEYVCQPFFIDKDTSENLKSLMGVIVRTISKEIELPKGCTKDKKIISIIRNLEAFIRSYTAEILE